MPKVSVIIPTHNRAGFLKNSVKSVLEQTFKDFELIISDDASTDGTMDYVESLTDPRVIYIRNENALGVAHARNKALDASKGQYIAFLDDDDEWFSQKLERQMDCINKSGGEIQCVYTATISVDLESGTEQYVPVPIYKGNILNEILYSNFLPTSSLLIEKKCFDKSGQFDTEFKAISDFDMWIRIAGEYNFDCIPQPLVKRTIHEVRITNDYSAVIAGLKRIMSKHSEIYSKNKIALSEYKLRLGIFYCYNNNLREGRKAFIEAIRLNPYNIKHYYNYGLSILGANAFMKLKILRSNLTHGLKGILTGK